MYTMYTYFRTQGIISTSSPVPSSHVPIRCRDLSENIHQKSHRQIGNVVGEDVRSIGDCDSPTATFRQVHVVEAGAWRDYEAERREPPENLGCDDGAVGGGQESPGGAAMGGQELVQTEIWVVPGLEVVELVGGEGLEESEARRWKEDQYLRKVF